MSVRKAHGNDTVDISVELRSDPDRHNAWKVYDGKKEVWIPKSQGELEKNPTGRLYTLTIPEWLAEKEGLI